VAARHTGAAGTDMQISPERGYEAPEGASRQARGRRSPREKSLLERYHVNVEKRIVLFVALVGGAPLRGATVCWGGAP